jgi:hypothetical protein
MGLEPETEVKTLSQDAAWEEASPRTVHAQQRAGSPLWMTGASRARQRKMAQFRGVAGVG